MWNRLSPKEREVAELLLKAYPDRAIAEELNLALRTVKGHLTRMYLKGGIDAKRFHGRILLAVRLYDERKPK